MELVVAGEGPQFTSLQSLVIELGIADRVDFRGRLNEVEIVQFLRDLDVYVQSSRGETVSTSVLQAFGTGTTVVASDVAGLRDLVRDAVDGFLVPAGCAEALADRLSTLADDALLRRQVGEEGRARAVRDFSAARMCENWCSALRSIDPNGRW